MKILTMAVLSLAITACGEYKERITTKAIKVCPDEVTAARRDVTLECIKNANQMVDDPEYSVQNCRDFADNLYCDHYDVVLVKTSENSLWTEVDRRKQLGD